MMAVDQSDLIDRLCDRLVQWEMAANHSMNPDIHQRQPLTTQKLVALIMESRPTWDAVEVFCKERAGGGEPSVPPAPFA